MHAMPFIYVGTLPRHCKGISRHIPTPLWPFLSIGLPMAWPKTFNHSVPLFFAICILVSIFYLFLTESHYCWLEQTVGHEFAQKCTKNGV